MKPLLVNDKIFFNNRKMESVRATLHRWKLCRLCDLSKNNQIIFSGV